MKYGNPFMGYCKKCGIENIKSVLRGFQKVSHRQIFEQRQTMNAVNAVKSLATGLDISMLCNSSKVEIIKNSNVRIHDESSR